MNALTVAQALAATMFMDIGDEVCVLILKEDYDNWREDLTSMLPLGHSWIAIEEEGDTVEIYISKDAIALLITPEGKILNDYYPVTINPWFSQGSEE